MKKVIILTICAIASVLLISCENLESNYSGNHINGKHDSSGLVINYNGQNSSATISHKSASSSTK